MRSAKELIEVIFDRETSEQAAYYSKLFTQWENIVGSREAAHSKIIDLRQKMLIVETDSSSWLQILELKSSKILADVKKAFPELNIEGVSFKCRHQYYKEDVERKPLPEQHHEKEYEEVAKRALEEVENPELKALFKNLEEAIIRRNTKGR